LEPRRSIVCASYAQRLRAQISTTESIGQDCDRLK
jgi:hypothetical protein